MGLHEEYLGFRKPEDIEPQLARRKYHHRCIADRLEAIIHSSSSDAFILGKTFGRFRVRYRCYE